MLSARIYYQAKPFIPAPLRRVLRQLHVRRILKRCGNVWPIHQGAGRKPKDWPGWPDGYDFAFVLTHDVEGPAGLDRVKQLAELEMELGFRSSFNLIPEGRYAVPPALREWLTDRGFEVGVHDLHHDGKLFSSREGFRRKAGRINKYLQDWDAVGFRSGYMLRNLDWLPDLRIQYDASSFDTDPFEPQPDGVETIFPFWVPGRNGQGGFVEMPYTLPQDSTLFISLLEKSDLIWRRKLDWVAVHGGMALLNVHPDYISFDREPQKGRNFCASLYRDFLLYVKQQYSGRFWAPLAANLATWYQEERAARLKHQVGNSESSRTGQLATGRGRRIPSPSSDPRPEMALTYRANGSAVAQIQHTVSSSSDADRGTDVLPVDNGCLKGKRVAVVLLSSYPHDPRPRRAAEALVSAGMMVDVICVKRNEEEAARDQINGVDILRIPMRHRRGGKLAYAIHYGGFVALSFALLTFRSLTRRYHVVHVHNMPDILVLSAIVPRLLGAKVVLDLHDPMPELLMTIFGLREQSRGVRLLKGLERLSIGFAHAVVTVNKTCRRIFSSRSCQPEKIEVVMNSPDEGIFGLRAPSVPGNRNLPLAIMYHGSLVERNGLALAVEAISQLARRGARVDLRIFGDHTRFLDSVLNSVHEKGLDEHVRYLGPRTLDEIVQEIDDCDCGIIPNLRSIFTEINTPTRIFEFLFRGKPVIAPSSPGILEYFTQEDLLTFQLGSAEDLAQKIEFVINHPDKVREITMRGQRVCLSHRWSEERHVFVELIRNLLRGDQVLQGAAVTS